MERAIEIIPLDTCHVCMTPNSIEMYNNYNSPCNYSSKLRNGTDEFTSLKAYAKFMKCKKCGSIFSIDWSKGIPQPQYFNTFYNVFINTFLEHYLKGGK